MQTAREATQQILRLKHIPPLSATASRLLVLLTDENLSLAGLARVIGQDPAIAARILGVANSAYFGQVIPINSIEEAIIRVLGLNMVRSLAFSIAVSGVFKTERCQGFDLEAYWYRSLATATLSRQLCLLGDLETEIDPDAIYLAGLLFDIGTLVLVHLFPDDYSAVLQRLKTQPPEDAAQLETALIGITSREAGGWLIDRWHLPERVVQVVSQTPVSDEIMIRETLLVANAADWVRSTTDATRKELSQMESGAHLGLSGDALERVRLDFMNREEEIRSIASMLVG